VEWDLGERILLARSPCYSGNFPGNAEQVECTIFPDLESALEAYADNSVDAVSMINADPDTTAWAQELYGDELVSIPYPTVLYLSFRTDKPPFNDIRVRKAFISAVDREALSKNAFYGQRMPAVGGFVPPGMPAHSPSIGLPFDPELARHLLAQAGYPGGRGFPEISWIHGRSSRTQLVIDFMQTAWKENLGLELDPRGMDEWGAFLEKATKDPANLTIIGWGADYPDPECMLSSTFHSKEGENIPRWQNERFDALVEEAGWTTDQARRVKLYQEADRILVADEAVVMPISYREGRLLVKSRVVLPRTLSIQLPLKNVILKGGIIET
jgi:oligopeptide transport system substrate-binding protein